jgi:hypothetical protein
VPVSSHWNSMTKSAGSFDGGGACTPPGLDERGIKTSRRPRSQESFIMSPELHIFIPPSSLLYLHSSILRPRACGLILSGRLKEHDAWQVVRGEQGLVVVPLIRNSG